MVVDVIASEIGEGGDGEVVSVHPLLDERVRADLQAGAGAARIGHLPKEGGKIGGVRRGLVGGDGTRPEVVTDGTDQTPWTTFGVLKEVTEQCRDGGLAVGARDPGEAQAGFRMALEATGDLREDAARRLNLRGIGTGNALDRVARDDGGGAARDRLVDKGVALRPDTVDGKEQGPGHDAATIGHDGRDAMAPVPGSTEHRNPLQQDAQGGVLGAGMGGAHRSARARPGRADTGGISKRRMQRSASCLKIGAETLPP